MFYRLNLTDYSLNEQEKRNSMDSAFGKAAESIADLEFWTKHKIFSPRDIRRMGDVEYCSSILLLCREGIVDQTKQETLDQIYTDFVDEYIDKDKDLEKVCLCNEFYRRFNSNGDRIFFKQKSANVHFICSCI